MTRRRDTTLPEPYKTLAEVYEERLRELQKTPPDRRPAGSWTTESDES